MQAALSNFLADANAALLADEEQLGAYQDMIDVHRQNTALQSSSCVKIVFVIALAVGAIYVVNKL